MLKQRSMRWLLLAAVASALMVLGLARFGGAEDGASHASPAVPGNGVVAYYFHTNFRCSTCRKLESLSRRALESGFGKQLGSGELAFRVVNVEAQGNKHFVKDFQLVTKSLVLVEYRGGKVVRSKTLPKIWQLVRDRDAFIHYVQNETRAFLGER